MKSFVTNRHMTGTLGNRPPHDMRLSVTLVSPPPSHEHATVTKEEDEAAP